MVLRVSEHGTSSVRNCMVPATFSSTLSGRPQQNSTERTHTTELRKEPLAANRPRELIKKTRRFLYICGCLIAQKSLGFVVERTVLSSFQATLRRAGQLKRHQRDGNAELRLLARLCPSERSRPEQWHSALALTTCLSETHGSGLSHEKQDEPSNSQVDFLDRRTDESGISKKGQCELRD